MAKSQTNIKAYTNRFMTLPFTPQSEKIFKILILIIWIVVGLILLMSKTPILDIFKYVGFQILYVLVPGLFFIAIIAG